MPVNWLLTYDDSYSRPYVWPGDSGGALLLNHVTDSPFAVLAGITAALNIRTVENAGNTEYESAFVQLAAYRDWIDGVMLGDGHDDQLANWMAMRSLAAAVPELPPAALLVAGLAMLGWRRARRR